MISFLSGLTETLLPAGMEGESASTLIFSSVGEKNWEVCAVNGNLSDCLNGTITILASPSSNGDGEGGGNATSGQQSGSGLSGNSEETSGLTSSQYFAIGLLLILAILLAFLVGRRGGGGSGDAKWGQQQQFTNSGSANLPAAPNLPPADNRW